MILTRIRSCAYAIGLLAIASFVTIASNSHALGIIVVIGGMVWAERKR